MVIKVQKCTLHTTSVEQALNKPRTMPGTEAASDRVSFSTGLHDLSPIFLVLRTSTTRPAGSRGALRGMQEALQDAASHGTSASVPVMPEARAPPQGDASAATRTEDHPDSPPLLRRPRRLRALAREV